MGFGVLIDNTIKGLTCLYEIIQGISMKEKDLHMNHLDLLQQISLLLDYPMLCLATTGMIIPL